MLSLIGLIIGLVLGSFANVVIHRLPRGESIIWPASHCPHCNYNLQPIDLVPILSWAWLRGKCRKCANPIHWRYPAIELLGGIIGVIIANLLAIW